MDYEKKYKEALSWMQSLYKGLHGPTKEDAERFFPELKESEDERIRKEIIDFLQETIDNVGESPNKWTMYNAKKWIAWIEKQGDVKFPEVPIEHGKYYYCIKDYYSGGKLRAKRGDVVQALRGMSIMILDSMEAGKYFLPVNKIEKQGEQKPADKIEPKFKVGDIITSTYNNTLK